MQELESHKCHGGMLSVWEHESAALKCSMKFSVFLPPQVQSGNVPFITYLSGLTCTHDNFTSKANAYKSAAEHGVAIIAPDTSPRGEVIPDDAESYDFGQGAGFYINATQAPWAEHYQMERYIAAEFRELVIENFPVQANKHGLMGHSMGGHGALTLGLKYSEHYKSLSAFSPIVAPSQVPWGHKAFSGYLGDNQSEWAKHDASALMAAAGNRSGMAEILIDQGGGDQFLEEQLKPEIFAQACLNASQALNLRMHEGYDHSYFFIQSFIDDHIKHHAEILKDI